MIPPELEALVLADSVGALDRDERVELLARLDGLTPEQRSEVAHLYDIASTVALTAPALEPPAHVRERVLAATREPERYTVWAADAEWVDTGMPGIRSRILTVDKALLTECIARLPRRVMSLVDDGLRLALDLR